MGLKKTIAIVHEALSDNLSADEQDTLIQVQCIEATLRKLGYETATVPVTLDLSHMKTTIEALHPLMVFNLVESLGGNTGNLHFVPSILHDTGFAFTGSGASALFLTTDKPLSKKIMQQAGIFTPAWQDHSSISSEGLMVPVPFIIKPAGDDASRNIADSSVVYFEEQYYDLHEKVIGSGDGTFFIEAFIEGREISISLLSNTGQPEVLPPSEILFNEFPESKPHIVNYNAKWSPGSFEYAHTPRSFEFRSKDHSLLNRLKKIACRCWDCFGLRGYARIDFRIDETNRPWVIDVNANPCLSPDSGFIATARTAGYTYEGIISRILDEAYFHSPYCRMHRMN